MASKWVEFRDGIVNALNVEEVTEELKQKVSLVIINEVFPSIEESMEKFIKTIREQAPNESGWCRIRDGIVLPLVLEAVMLVVKTVLTKSLTEENKKLVEGGNE